VTDKWESVSKKVKHLKIGVPDEFYGRLFSWVKIT
jgi:hypothetical protein